jgi:hypothetical protein
MVVDFAAERPDAAPGGGSDVLRYRRLERVMGIEPTLAAWEAAVLPLNYTRAGRAILEVLQLNGQIRPPRRAVGSPAVGCLL